MMANSSKYFSDEGIVLSSKTILEADKLLTVYTKNFGKLDVLGKNLAKLNSRRAMACSTLSYCKFAISKGRIETLAEVVLLDQFSNLKSNLVKLAESLIAAESLQLITPISVPSSEIFLNFLDLLKKIERSQNLRQIQILRAAFQVKILVKSGWLGKDFEISNFANFYNLENFVISKFESISGKKLKSPEFAKAVRF